MGGMFRLGGSILLLVGGTMPGMLLLGGAPGMLLLGGGPGMLLLGGAPGMLLVGGGMLLLVLGMFGVGGPLVVGYLLLNTELLGPFTGAGAW